MALNKIVVMGRVTHDIVLRGNEDNRWATFGIACERDKVNDEGIKETDFFNCVVFGTQAEFVNKWFHKGSIICVTGRMQQRETTKNGASSKIFEIAVQEVYFGEAKQKEH